jgi:predicted nucleic acid-binding protein
VLSSSYITVFSRSTAAWDLFPELPIREMHDRMIAAYALARKIPLVSNDPAFGAVGRLRVIW